MRIVECVPNISEGRDRAVIEAVSGVIHQVEGCELLDVDPGAATNRTVITFVGSPEAVVEGAPGGLRRFVLGGERELIHIGGEGVPLGHFVQGESRDPS